MEIESTKPPKETTPSNPTTSSRELHQESDVDNSVWSQHHTLGLKARQASPGNHIHNGVTSKKLGAGMGLTLSGSKGGNVALTNLIALLKNFIEFTDNTT